MTVLMCSGVGLIRTEQSLGIVLATALHIYEAGGTEGMGQDRVSLKGEGGQ